MGGNNQPEYIKFKKGVHTLENFYVRANENYWNFLIFSVFPLILPSNCTFSNTLEKNMSQSVNID